MKILLIAAAAVLAIAGLSGLAEAQTYVPPPASPPPSAIGSSPTMWRGPYPDPAPPDINGTAWRPAAATPDCGPANPQHGFPLPNGQCP